MQQAVAEIQDLSLQPLVLQRFGWGGELLGTLRNRARTWARLAVLSVTGEEADLVGDKLADALGFHKTVAGQAAAHLHLF